MACQKVCKQGRDDIIVKVNLQSQITILLKQQSKDRVSSGQKIEQGMLLLQAPEIMSDTIRQMSENTRDVHMLHLPQLRKCK